MRTLVYICSIIISLSTISFCFDLLSIQCDGHSISRTYPPPSRFISCRFCRSLKGCSSRMNSSNPLAFLYLRKLPFFITLYTSYLALLNRIMARARTNSVSSIETSCVMPCLRRRPLVSVLNSVTCLVTSLCRYPAMLICYKHTQIITLSCANNNIKTCALTWLSAWCATY